MEVSKIPVSFPVGVHTVLLWLDQKRWSMSLDGSVASATFETQAEAWEAGVRAADRIDRTAVAPST